MPDYDFRVLSPIDFESLVRDLLQKELGITLESFSSGRDTGIDFRYTSAAGRKLIVQCKHYPDSRFETLLSRLKNKELSKVRTLRPDRYIFATSQRLTPDKKKKILDLFDPFILQTSDIYGREDLNNLLGKFKGVERDHIKLWFSNALLIERMLHTRRLNITRETLSKIQRDARLYVQNESFYEALKILERHNFCLIVGVPGIGKTMLAEMLLLRYHHRGFEIIKIENYIGEASEVDYANQRRLFYYDDFLGQASIAEKLKKNEDQSLLNFILAIKRSRVSKLILTTREYILNHTKLVYEKIDRTRFDLETCVIDLSKYTRLNRAKILFNHIYFSSLPGSYRTALLKNRSYLGIIDHPNYNPRIIEYLTDISRLKDVTARNYVARFLSSLDNPEDLWHHAFTSQLLPESRDLLTILVTLPREVFLDDLESAFRLYRRKNVRNGNPHKPSEAFKRALKELDGNFIATDKSGDHLVVRFQNPSVRDFLQNYLASSVDDLQAMLSSIACFDQLHWVWEHRHKGTEDYRFRSIIKQKLPKELISNLGVILQLPVYSLDVQYVYDEFIKRRTNVSLVDRLLLIVSIGNEIKTNESQQILNKSLVDLTTWIDSGRVNSSDLINLMEVLEGKVDTKRWKKLLATTKTFVADNLRDLDDYRALIKFSKAYPYVFSNVEMERLAKSFPSAARTFVWESSTSDPDDLRTYAEEIDSIADDLEVDVFDIVNDLEHEAREAEQRAEEEERRERYNRPRENFSREDFLSKLREAKHEASDSDIESMFTSLQ
ncbi:MAG TPA: restriction endonuclease [Pyrinomonadaceae bacterium]